MFLYSFYTVFRLFFIKIFILFFFTAFFLFIIDRSIDLLILVRSNHLTNKRLLSSIFYSLYFILLFSLFTNINTYIIFNIIEYFSFINLLLLFLFLIITLFFIIINSTLSYYSNLNFNNSIVEFSSSFFSLLFSIIIISPALIILLDFDLIVIPSFIIYSSGFQ